MSRDYLMDQYFHEANRENILCSEASFTRVDVERVHVLRVQRPIGSRRVTRPGHYCVWLSTFRLLRDAGLE